MTEKKFVGKIKDESYAHPYGYGFIKKYSIQTPKGSEQSINDILGEIGSGKVEITIRRIEEDGTME